MENSTEMRRAFLIVLDGCGAGEAPDAAAFGDVGSHTLASAAESGVLSLPTLSSLGMGRIEGLSFLGAAEKPLGAWGRMRELSNGKDTTTGHWELAGLVSESPPPTYPNGFPPEIIEAFEKETGRGVLVNRPYSGTEVIAKYGEEQIRTGKLIVYTSADSVFQIAAHTDVVPLEELYEDCRIARRLLVGRHAVGRVIARPFTGSAPDFVRTADRRDFSLEPPKDTLLDAVKNAGMETVAVGKISDIFAGKGITRSVGVHGNPACMEAASAIAEERFSGFCFINLVDTDINCGHRRDKRLFAETLNAFDAWLSGFLPRLREGDLLMITADHGCDPGFRGTDHTRELVPLLVYGRGISARNLGLRSGFSDAGATVAAWLKVPYSGAGTSFLPLCTDPSCGDDALCTAAREAMQKAYSPYSMCSVGAALLCADGKVYTGFNIENASFSPTVCAERTAFIRALCDGEREFTAIAICGTNNRLRREGDLFTPCGVCRQFMREFCGGSFRILVTTPRGDCREEYTLAELFPRGFGPEQVN